MKRPITLLLALYVAVPLGGCNPSPSSDPAAQASPAAPSKPNPWTLDSKLPPGGSASASASASAAPAAEPSASDAAKPSPFSMTPPAGPNTSEKQAEPTN